MPETFSMNYERIVYRNDSNQDAEAAGKELGGGDIILVDLVGASATSGHEYGHLFGSYNGSTTTGDSGGYGITMLDLADSLDTRASDGHDPIADMLSRQENVSEDAAGAEVGGVLGWGVGGIEADDGNDDEDDDHDIIFDPDGDLLPTGKPTGGGEGLEDGGVDDGGGIDIILFDIIDGATDETASFDPYNQFNFNVEVGDDASAAAKDAYFVKNDAETVTSSDQTSGDGSDAEIEETGPGGVTIYADSNYDQGEQDVNEHAMTHEIGHALGLRHTDPAYDAEAALDFASSTGEPVENHAHFVGMDSFIYTVIDDGSSAEIQYDEPVELFIPEDSRAELGGGGDFILVDIVGPLETGSVDDMMFG